MLKYMINGSNPQFAKTPLHKASTNIFVHNRCCMVPSCLFSDWFIFLPFCLLFYFLPSFPLFYSFLAFIPYFSISFIFPLKKAVQLVKFLAYIWEVLGSDLCWHTDYPVKCFVVFLNSRQMPGLRLNLGKNRFLLHLFQFIIY